MYRCIDFAFFLLCNLLRGYCRQLIEDVGGDVIIGCKLHVRIHIDNSTDDGFEHNILLSLTYYSGYLYLTHFYSLFR